VLSTSIDWQYAVLTSFNAYIFEGENTLSFCRTTAAMSTLPQQQSRQFGCPRIIGANFFLILYCS